MTTDLDELAASCAAAFSDGDDAAGDRLFLELYALHLEPDMRRRLRYFAWNPHVREEVWSRVIDQVYVRMLRCGKPVERRWLATIYRRCTFDELSAVRRHASRAQPVGVDDDLEALIGRSLASEDPAGAAMLRSDIERAAWHFEADLNKPQWATLLRAMLDGHTRGSDIALATGMTQVRVRQVKMDVGRYLRGAGGGLLDVEDRG